MNKNIPFEGFSVRETSRKDVDTIRDFVTQLAVYEKLEHEMIAQNADYEKWLFDEKTAECILAEFHGKPVGFALFFKNFSTFLGKPGLYLEDLFIKPEFRGRGFGKAMLIRLAQIAVERGYGRFEWSVLDWNEPAILFYKSLGAKTLHDWKTMRVTGDALQDLASK